MSKQTIITCLRGTIGRWPKGKAIAIPVLVLVAMAGKAQTRTATITGYSPALKDGTVAESTVDNVRIANDTVKGGCFSLTVPVEGLTKSYLFLEGEGCPNHLMTIWLRPGVDVKVTGTDCLFPLSSRQSAVLRNMVMTRWPKCCDSVLPMLRGKKKRLSI